MRSAVGLLVETDDVDDPDVRHELGDEIHLCPDEVLVLESIGPREVADFDAPIG